MFQTTKQTSVAKKKMPNRLIAGFAALATTAIIATGGMAAAHTAPGHGHAPSPVGSGYGGNTSVATNISLTLNHSNNNIIQVIVNVFR
jgi:hypothetical protein